MHVFDVPYVLRQWPELGLLYGPLLPASLNNMVWSQAGDELRDEGRIHIYTLEDLTDLQMAEIELLDGRIVRYSNHHEMQQSRKTLTAMQGAGAHAARTDIVAMYREHVLNDLVTLKRVKMYHRADDFNRTNNSDLDTNTMSDGIGTWAKFSGITSSAGDPAKVLSNHCQVAAIGGGGYGYKDSTGSDLAAMRVSAVFQGTGSNYCTARCQSNAVAYGAIGHPSIRATQWNDTSTGAIIYLDNTQGITSGDRWGIDCDSTTTISYVLNGSIINASTDSTYSSGRWGIWINDGADLDDWRVEVPASGSSIKTIDGLAIASVKTVDSLALASIKTWNGLA